MPDKDPANRPEFSLLSKIWNIGLTVVGLVLLGHWLDHKFHRSNVFILAGAGLGLLYTFCQALLALKQKK